MWKLWKALVDINFLFIKYCPLVACRRLKMKHLKVFLFVVLINGEDKSSNDKRWFWFLNKNISSVVSVAVDNSSWEKAESRWIPSLELDSRLRWKNAFDGLECFWCSGRACVRSSGWHFLPAPHSSKSRRIPANYDSERGRLILQPGSPNTHHDPRMEWRRDGSS